MSQNVHKQYVYYSDDIHQQRTAADSIPQKLQFYLWCADEAVPCGSSEEWTSFKSNWGQSNWVPALIQIDFASVSSSWLAMLPVAHGCRGAGLE